MASVIRVKRKSRRVFRYLHQMAFENVYLHQMAGGESKGKDNGRSYDGDENMEAVDNQPG